VHMLQQNSGCDHGTQSKAHHACKVTALADMRLSRAPEQRHTGLSALDPPGTRTCSSSSAPREGGSAPATTCSGASSRVRCVSVQRSAVMAAPMRSEAPSASSRKAVSPHRRPASGRPGSCALGATSGSGLAASRQAPGLGSSRPRRRSAVSASSPRPAYGSTGPRRAQSAIGRSCHSMHMVVAAILRMMVAVLCGWVDIRSTCIRALHLRQHLTMPIQLPCNAACLCRAVQRPGPRK